MSSLPPAEPTSTEISTFEKYLNHFRLDRELASGGMGAVYLGFDESLQRPVAIKVIRPELAKQQSFLDRFVREARAQAQVTHSNVVQVYFVGQEREIVFMAMELVDGGSLSGKKISWQEALKHMHGLAEGLREAARLNIIHRDIKPANILLDRFGLAHLADFGLAAPVFSRETGEPMSKTPTRSASLPQLTQVGSVMGSPPYMSPEQARGDELDVRTDIYGLGATFYELITGEAPTQAVTLLELERFMAGPPPRTLVSRNLDIPRRVAALIDKCMERELSKRFQNYDEVLAAIEAAAPRPIVRAATVSRMLSWVIDVAVFAAASRFTLQVWPLLGFLALWGWVVMGTVVVGSTPGQWMMRLKLRRPPDFPVPVGRAMLRFALQHGWLAFASLTVASIYSSSGALLFVWAALTAVLFLVGVGGSAAAAFSRDRRTLVDRLSGTRVLVDVGGDN